MPLRHSLPCESDAGEGANIALNDPLTIIVLTPLTTFFAPRQREPLGEADDLVGVF
jgi:hypothetical protein